jgi:hypothetical protein
MPDRLDYIKQKIEEQKKSPAVILRHSDGEWAVGEIERLRSENEQLKLKAKYPDELIIDGEIHHVKRMI